MCIQVAPGQTSRLLPPLFRSKSSFSEKILTLVCLLKAAMMTFWSGAEERRGDKVRVQVQKPATPHFGPPPPDGSHPTCQVQVESQEQVHAEVWQLLCGVHWKAVLNDA